VTHGPDFGNIGRAENNGEDCMRNRLSSLLGIALLATSVFAFAIPASALPAAGGSTISNSAPANVETVRCRGCGWGIAAGVLGGALVGSAIANNYYYGPGPYYYGPPGPYYYGPPAPAYYDAPPGDAVAYCARRYRSYDPRSGTFLGNDGYRHPCP
jgi:hypothetical protein